MPAKIFIYSKLANDQIFHEYGPGGGNVQVTKRVIVIRGGAGVANQKTLVTPVGMQTEVTEDELAFLETDYWFNEWIRTGYLSVQKRRFAPSVEKVARDMVDADKSAQDTEKHYADGDGIHTPKLLKDGENIEMPVM